MRDTPLELAGYQPEKALQQLFEAWKSRESSPWALAGVPRWLGGINEENGAHRRQAKWDDTDLRYAFQPDVEWSEYVLELKSGAKYEPLAIAEVLHHCALIEHLDGTAKVPVIIGRYNAWTRATLWQLRNLHGALPLRYVEHTALRDPATAKEYLLFVEPFAAWTREDPPAPELDHPDLEGSWYRSGDASTFVKSIVAPTDRPPFLASAYRLVGQVEREPHAYVVWHGRNDGDDGQYRLVSP